jgi:hypothetical protein
MKTAIINTGFWEDDKIYSLNIDTRMLYLCLLTNPKRGNIAAFRCSDRLLVAYTGFNKEQVGLCKKQLEEAGLIKVVDDYIVVLGDAYVRPSRGKLSAALVEKETAELPEKVSKIAPEPLRSHSGGAPEIGIGIGNGIGIGIGNGIGDGEQPKQRNKDIHEVIAALEELDPENKKSHKIPAHQKMVGELLDKHGKQAVLEKVAIAKTTNEMPFFTQITTVYGLRDGWVKHTNQMKRKVVEKVDYDNKHQIIGLEEVGLA